MRFSVSTWENMPHTKKEQLTKMAENFFHLLQQPVQDLTSSNCGIFQLYFCKNFFDPNKKSKIINHENLNKLAIEVIFNEIFSTDVNENEYVIKEFKDEHNLQNL